MSATVPWQRLNPPRGLIQKMRWSMKSARDRQILVTLMHERREKYLVLEVFAGCARLTQVAKDRDGWEALDPVDLIYGQDLKNSLTRWEVKEMVKRCQPDLLTLSPRCGPWSQFQRINPNIDKVMADRRRRYTWTSWWPDLIYAERRWLNVPLA